MMGNKEILNTIEKAMLKHPALRFNQILHRLNIVNRLDSFNDEPEDVIDRMKKSDLYKEINERDSFKGVF